MTAAELWDRLSADGLVEGELPDPDRPASPWFVRVMLGIAGWIGAFFLMSFVGIAFSIMMENGAFGLIAGAACCAGAWALFRSFEGNDFAEQFGLAVSLVGQMLIAYGLSRYLNSADAPLYFAMAAVEAALVLAVPNFLHRVLAAGGAAIAFALGIGEMSLHGLATPLLCLGLALVWLEPRLWAGQGRLWRPVGYGLVLALLLTETFRLFDTSWWYGLENEEASWLRLYAPLAGRILNAAILLWAAFALLRRESVPPASRTGMAALAAALLLGLLSVEMPGLASALLILLLGFAAGNRILAALGILNLLGFVSHYYYSLHASLLEKSGLLAITGLCLLAAFFLLRSRFLSPAAADPAHA